jgi:adenine-specific DNA-methyltransferase
MVDRDRQHQPQNHSFDLLDVVNLHTTFQQPDVSASFVSNTSGVFKSFHQGWGGRTQTALERIESLPCACHVAIC